MGNHSSHAQTGHSQRLPSQTSIDGTPGSAFSGSARTGSKKNTACLIKLFQVKPD